MLAWAIRIVTFIVNSLLLTGFALLYTWAQQRASRHVNEIRWHDIDQVLLTIGFLVLFHLSSVLRIMQQHYITGYGWNYLNFQVGVILFAMLFCKNRWLFPSLAFVLFVWYWWLPHVPVWFGFFIITLGLMWVAKFFSAQIINNWWLFMPFSLAFSVPFMWSNLLSLRGIDVGWPWEIGTTLVISELLWLIHKRLTKQRQEKATLIQEANTDNLTQLNNFRVFNEDLLQAFTAYQKEQTTYTLYTFDIDYFKRVNDRFGHIEGNIVLERIATQLNQLIGNMPGKVKSYRVGGEEFSFIVFAQQTAQSPFAVAQQVRESLGNLTFTTKQGDSFQITVSIGEAHVTDDDQNYMDVYKRADKKLYQSKQSGRNMVTVQSV